MDDLLKARLANLFQSSGAGEVEAEHYAKEAMDLFERWLKGRDPQWIEEFVGGKEG